MPEDSENVAIRGYHRMSKAFYARADEEVEILFGIYWTDGGTSGEMLMRWRILSTGVCAQLQSFCDSWEVLAGMPDLIEALGKLKNENITEPEFSKLLDTLGFKDLTSYKHPYK